MTGSAKPNAADVGRYSGRVHCGGKQGHDGNGSWREEDNFAKGEGGRNARKPNGFTCSAWVSSGYADETRH